MTSLQNVGTNKTVNLLPASSAPVISKNLNDLKAKEEKEKNIRYLNDVFVKACISALQSESYGHWIHLIEVVTTIKRLSEILSCSGKALHYLHRVYQYCNVNPEIKKLNILPLLEETFPNVDFSQSFSTSISSINLQTSTTVARKFKCHSNSSSDEVIVHKDVYYPGDFNELFSTDHSNKRIYKAAPLQMTDLQRFLPYVVSEVIKLECTWSKTLGITLQTLNTDLPEVLKCDDNRSHQIKDEEQLSVKQPQKKHKKSIASTPQPRTGREVVESLVSSTRRSQIKVWYLNFAPSLLYNPYDLVVVEKAAIKKEHVVISVFGILYVKLNGMSELVSLGQWYSEAVCFETIRHIRFFRMIREIKCLNKWRASIRRVSFEKQKKHLDSLLLHKVPAIPNCFHRIRDLLEQLRAVQFFPNFKETHIQMETLESVMKSFIIEQKRYLKKFLLFSWEVIASCYDECKNYYEYCKAQIEKDETNSKESIAKLKKAHRIQVENFKIAEKNLQNFDKSLKLINLMIFSEIVSIFSRQVVDFIHHHIMQNSVGSFQVTVFTSPEVLITFVPSTNTIYENLYNIFNSVLEQLQYHVTSIIKTIIKSNVHENNLLEHFESYMNEEDPISLATLQDILSQESKSFSITGNTKKFLDTVLFSQFLDAITTQSSLINEFENLKYELDVVASNEAASYFKALCWLEVIASSVHKHNAKDVEDWRLMSAAEIERQIITMKSHAQHMATMEMNYITSNHLLFIDSSEIKQMLLPQVKNILKTQVRFLLHHNLVQANKYMEELSKFLTFLSNPSLDVEEFAKYFVFMNEIKFKVPEYVEKIEHVRAVFDVVRLSYAPLTQEEEDVDEELRVMWEKFQYSIHTGQEFISAHVPTLTNTLRNEIDDMLNAVISIANVSTTGKFLDETQNTRMILTDLTKNFEEFGQLSRKIRTYADCLRMITGDETDFKTLNDAQQQITTRYEIWKYLERTFHTINSWRLSRFSKFRANMPKVVEKMTEWKQARDGLNVNLSREDRVLMKWTELLDRFQDNLTILQKLVHPSLKDKHWHEIFIVLENNYDPSHPYSVADIIDMPLHKNYEKIEVIWLAAISQAALEECLSSIIREWEKREFKFAKNLDIKQKSTLIKKNKTSILYTLASLVELSCKAEDSLVTLQSMLVSPHVADVKENASFWSHQLQELKEYIDLFLDVQQQWQYVSKIFQNRRMQSNHAADYQIFMEINAMYKDIMTSLLADPKVLNVLEKKRFHTHWRELQGIRLKAILNDVLQKQTIVIKHLEDYLVKIREAFPRLYFLSNNEMLQLLAMTRNPPAMKKFFRACFPGVHEVKFEMPLNMSTKAMSPLDLALNSHLLEAVAVSGAYNEELLFHFGDKVQFQGSAEKCLKYFDQILKKAMWSNIVRCFNEFTTLYEGRRVCVDIATIRSQSFHRKYTYNNLLLVHDCMWNKMYTNCLANKQEFKSTIKLFNEMITQLTDFLQKPQQWGLTTLSDRRMLLLTQAFLLQALYYKDKLRDLELENPTDHVFARFTNIEVVKIDKAGPLEIQQHEANIEIKCCDLTLQFGYEYYSPKEQLLITPLTERCFFNIFLAIQDFHVGTMTGKEINGKSETVLYIAQKLGRLLITLNCTTDMSLLCVQQLLHGCLSAGGLLCFENMHLLPVNHLSIIGQNFYEIRTALNLLSDKKKDPEPLTRRHSVAEICSIPSPTEKYKTKEDDRPYLRPSFGVILLNNRLVEINSLYGAMAVYKENLDNWKDVPDNFRESLRPVSMSFPHTLKLYEAWLILGRFVKFQSIASRLQMFVNDCNRLVSMEELLEKMPCQKLKTNAMSLKKVKELILQSAKAYHCEKVEDETLEETYIVQTFLQAIKPCLKHDLLVTLVQTLVLLFPTCKNSLQHVLPVDALLIESIKEQMHADNLVLKQDFLSKVLELHRNLSSSQSVILLGDTCTAKTTCYTTLSRAMCQFSSPWSQRKDLLNRNKQGGFTRTNLNIIYPNMFDNGQLFGTIDQTKNSWVDGLLSKILDNSAHCKSNIQQWIVLDGNLHDSWIIPFESLLNCSKQYTLGSSRTVHILDDCKLLFETDNLHCVSPSIISSSTIIYFNAGQAVDWLSVFTSWRHVAYSKYALEQAEFTMIEEVLDYVLLKISSFVSTECEDIFTADLTDQKTKQSGCCDMVTCGYVLNCLSAILNMWKSRKDRSKDNVLHTEEDKKRFISHIVAWSVANAVVAFVHERSLPQLDTFVRQVFSTCPVHPVIFPSDMLDCYFDGKIGELVPWNQAKYEANLTMPTNVVATNKLLKLHHVSDLLLTTENNVLLLGSPASGKSTFKQFLTLKYNITKLQISRAITIEDFQETLSTHTKALLEERNRMKIRNSKKQDRLIFFIDDINESPSHHLNGEKFSYECLRQVTSEGGMYNIKEKFYQYLPDSNFILSYTPTGCNRLGADYSPPLNSRFYRHFNLLRVDAYTENEITSIFSFLTMKWLQTFDWFQCKQIFIKILCTTTLDFHKEVQEKLHTKHLHYIFSFHEIASVMKGLCQFSIDAQKHLSESFNEYFFGQKPTFVKKSVSEMLDAYDNLPKSKELVINTLLTFVQHYFNELKNAYSERILIEDITTLNDVKVIDKFESLVETQLQQRMDSGDCIAEGFLSILKDVCDSLQGKKEEVCFTRLFMNNEMLSSYKKVKKDAFKKRLQRVNDHKLVIFDELVDHCAALSKVINHAGGHALLASRNGHGREKVTEMCAKLIGYSLYTISHLTCSTRQKEIIKDACYSAGLNGKSTILYVSDAATKETMDYVSTLVKDGCCSYLYSTTELNLLSSQLQPGTNHRNRKHDNTAAIQERFFTRVKQHLHLVVCVNYDQLDNLINQYPMFLMKISVVDIYEEWSHQTLAYVAKELLDDWSKDPAFSCYSIKEAASSLSKLYEIAKDFAKNIGVCDSIDSPLKYIQFVELFKDICSLVQYEASTELEHLKKATGRILEAEHERDRLTSEIQANIPLMKEAKFMLDAADAAMKATQAEHDRLKERCIEQANYIHKLQKPVEELTKATQEDFDQLSPLYEEALKALSLLDAYAIEELRSYRAPPDGVINITNMLCKMFRLDGSWENAKHLLMRDKFNEELQHYDKDHLSTKVFNALSRFIETPIADLEYVKTQSMAAYQLALWMHAVHSYGDILRRLQPKKDELANAKRNVEMAHKELMNLQQQCTEVNKILEHRIREMEEKVKCLRKLETKHEFLRTSKRHAVALLESMEVFSKEWFARIAYLETQLSSLLSSSMLTAGCMIYNTILSIPDQEKLLQGWISILPDQTCDLTIGRLCSSMLSLTDEEVIWRNQNKNMLSSTFLQYILQVRGLSFLATKCWPLLVDPSGNSELLVKTIEEESCEDNEMSFNPQESWITKVYNFKKRKNNRTFKNVAKTLAKLTASIPDTTSWKLTVANADDPQLDSILQEAMENGQPLLVKNIERLLETNLLLKALLNRSKLDLLQVRCTISVGDKKIDCSSNFRLYLSAGVTTDYLLKKRYFLPLHYTIPINMEPDMQSLYVNLFHFVVSIEKPLLEASIQRLRLDLQNFNEEENAVRLIIFNNTTDGTNRLLERKNVRDYMGFQQEKLMLLIEKHQISKSFINDQLKQLEVYRPLTEYFCRVYFLIQKLCAIHPLYTFSLNSFMKVVEDTYDEFDSTKAITADVSYRNEELQKTFTRKIFAVLSHVLFYEHVLLFPLCLVLEEARITFDMCDDEWDVLTMSFGKCRNHCAVPLFRYSRPGFLSEESWSRFEILSSKVPLFNDLAKILTNKSPLWVEYFKLTPMLLEPYCFDVDLHNYHLALLWLAYDINLFPSIHMNMILCHLGPEFIKIPSFDFKHACDISDMTEIHMIVLPADDQPIIQDPVHAILKLAKAKKLKHVSIISLGTEEEMKHATHVLHQAAKLGYWLVLNNCDLVEEWSTGFLKEIIRIFDTAREEVAYVKSVNEEEVDIRKIPREISPLFRLFMIFRSETRTLVPDYILQNSRVTTLQHLKNDESKVEEYITECEDLQVRPTVKKISTTTYVSEIMKSRRIFYKNQLKLTCRDNNYITRLTKLMHTYHKGLDDRVKDVTLLPRLSNCYDHMLLHKPLNDNVAAIFDESFPLQRQNLSKVYSITKCYPSNFSIEKIKTISMTIHELLNLSNQRKTILFTRQYLANQLQKEVHGLRNYVSLVSKDFTVLVKAMEGQAPWTAYLRILLRNISDNVLPEAWCYGEVEMTLKGFIEDLRHKLLYFYALLHSPEEPVKIDLNMLQDPDAFIAAIRYQYSADYELGVMDKYWVGQVVSGDMNSQNISIVDGVLFENLTLHNAHIVNSRLTPCIGHTVSSVLIHYKPLQQALRRNRCIPVYSNDFNHVIFEMDSMNLYEYHKEVYFTLE